MARLYSSRHIIKILEDHGLIFISQKGSHKKFRKKYRTVIVPDPRKEIPMGTFHSILKQSDLKQEDFIE